MLIATIMEMSGSEPEFLDAVRQPVVTLLVKELPSRVKKIASRQLYAQHPPDEALSWHDVNNAPGVKVRHSLQQLQLKS